MKNLFTLLFLGAAATSVAWAQQDPLSQLMARSGDAPQPQPAQQVQAPAAQPPVTQPVMQPQQGPVLPPSSVVRPAGSQIQLPNQRPLSSVVLSNGPSILNNGAPVANVDSLVSAAEARPAINNLRASLAETTYPRVVRKDGNNGYTSVNVPIGWKLVPLRTQKFSPAPMVTLANGETIEISASPMILIPDGDLTRVPVNPRSLQTLHNFQLAQLDLLRQLREAFRPVPVTQIE